jgi:benzaldehyde dehydrogenase (NAD)
MEPEMTTCTPEPRTKMLVVPDAMLAGCYFDGRWQAAKTCLDVIDKAAQGKLGNIGIPNADQLEQTFRAASAAQVRWAATPAEERAVILRRAAEGLRDHGGEVTDWIVRESGATRAKAEWELQAAAQELLYASAHFIQPEGYLLASPDPTRTSLARRVPIGVVGVITPWNVPLVLAVRSVAPALALGNAVVLKPDPQTAVCGGIVLARVLEEAGLPPGVLCLINGGAEIGQALVAAAETRMITFTGSTAAGRAVGELAGRHLKKVALELGGNNALIVLDDCDLDAAVSAASFGSFFHQGQICMATGRHLVHRRIADDYVRKLAEHAARLRVGDGFRETVDLGPLINAKQCNHAAAIVRDSVAMGARLITGGTHEGLFFRPTVLADVTPDMPAFVEEIFAPVAPIIVVDSDEEAVTLANQTSYGLSAAVQTSNIARGLEIAKRLHTGMVHVNDQTVGDLPQIPMGGRGASGNGARFGTLTALDEFTEWQWLTYAAVSPSYPF